MAKYRPELNPCEVCGSDVEIRHFHAIQDGDKPYYYIMCPLDGSHGDTGNLPSRAAIIRRWNEGVMYSDVTGVGIDFPSD